MELFQKTISCIAVTPRHDLAGTCYNFSSIEINRIHRYPGIRSRKEALLLLFEYRLSSEIAIQIKVDIAKQNQQRRRQTLN